MNDDVCRQGHRLDLHYNQEPEARVHGKRLCLACSVAEVLGYAADDVYYALLGHRVERPAEYEGMSRDQRSIMRAYAKRKSE